MLGNPAGIRILQNNLHKCRARTHAILNDPDTKDFTMLMIQEQYWSHYTKSSPTHHAWTLFEPTGTTPEKHPRSAIYVNRKAFTAAQITQIPIPSAEVTVIQIDGQEGAKPSLFINIYNPYDDSALPALQQCLQQMTPTRYELMLNIRGSVNTFLDYLILSYVKKGLAKYGGALMATTLRSCISSTCAKVVLASAFSF